MTTHQDPTPTPTRPAERHQARPATAEAGFTQARDAGKDRAGDSSLSPASGDAR